MDDKSGMVCNQGEYPVLNTLKKELTKPEPTSPKTKKGKVSSFPRGFWSKKPRLARVGSNSCIIKFYFSFCFKFYYLNFLIIYIKFLII